MDSRICFVGDSFVAGIGDDECMGWTGRLAKQSIANGHNLSSYNLGIRRDTSSDILARWKDECARRFNAGDRYFVMFAFGANDMTIENGELRVSEEQSIENFGKIIKQASSDYQVLALSPCPVCDEAQDERILALSERYEALANKLNIPYISVVQELLENPNWVREAKAGDGAHPNSGGYTYLAELINQNAKWFFAST